jgi:hypothetical protein
MQVDWPTRLVVLATAAATLIVAAPASAARTYPLSGKQIVVNADQGIYKMRGSLIGRWTITSFNEVADPTYFHATGTEEFKGCLDRRHDGSCKRDVSGTLSLTFEYWALFGSEDPDSLVWGSCWHPVVSGSGGFAGAQGVLVMADTPTKRGVKTAYIGNLTLPGKSGYVSPLRTARAGC